MFTVSGKWDYCSNTNIYLSSGYSSVAKMYDV